MIPNSIRKMIPDIAVYRKVGKTRVYFSLRDNIDYLRSWLGREPGVAEIMGKRWGLVLDIGCNIGLYSVLSAQNGNEVLAFDCSSKAIRFLERTARDGALMIIPFDRAMTVSGEKYLPPKSSHQENIIAMHGEGISSISLEMLMTFTPNLIKMDIEGGEVEFMRSKTFKEWIVRNKIALLLETHTDDEWWPDVPQRKIGDRHIFYQG